MTKYYYMNIPVKVFPAHVASSGITIIIQFFFTENIVRDLSSNDKPSQVKLLGIWLRTHDLNV